MIFHLERDLARWLKKEHEQPLDVVIENDVTSYALHKNVTSRPAHSYVLVAIFRDGIGGGVVAKGRTRRGHDGLAGEIGHIYAGSRDCSDKSPLARGTEPICRCGQVGCIEAWATPLAIFRRAHPERAAELVHGERAFEDLFGELAFRPQTDTQITEIFERPAPRSAAGWPMWFSGSTRQRSSSICPPRWPPVISSSQGRVTWMRSTRNSAALFDR